MDQLLFHKKLGRRGLSDQQRESNLARGRRANAGVVMLNHERLGLCKCGGKVEVRLAGRMVVSKERSGGLCRPVRPFKKSRVGGANSFGDAYRLGTLKTNGEPWHADTSMPLVHLIASAGVYVRST